MTVFTSTGLGPAPPNDRCLPLLEAFPDFDLGPPPMLDFLPPPPLPMIIFETHSYKDISRFHCEGKMNIHT